MSVLCKQNGKDVIYSFHLDLAFFRYSVMLHKLSQCVLINHLFRNQMEFDFLVNCPHCNILRDIYVENVLRTHCKSETTERISPHKGQASRRTLVMGLQRFLTGLENRPTVT